MAVFEVEYQGKRYNVEAADMQSAVDGLDQQFGTSPQPDREARPGPLQIVNEGLARGAGSIADAANYATEGIFRGADAIIPGDQSWLKASDNPIGGSNSIRSALKGGGDLIADATGRDPNAQPVDIFAGGDFQAEGAVENFLLGTGSAAGGVVPMVGVGKALQTASAPVVKLVGDTLAKPYASAPARAAASEIAAGGGAGVGMDIADRMVPDSGLAQVIGAVGGGVAAGAGPRMALEVAKRTPVISTLGKVAANELAPFTEAGAMERARRRMAGLVEDPEAAIASIRQPTIGNLSPAVATGEGRLMAAERLARDQDPSVDLRMRQTEAEGNDALREAMLDPARPAPDAAPLDGAPARQFMESAIERHIDGVGQALDQTFGAPKPNATAMTNLRTSTAPTRRAAYDLAYATPIDYSSEAGRGLTSLLSRVERAAPGAINLANRLMAGEGVESQQIMARVGDDGTVNFTRMPDTQQVDAIKRALDQMAETGDGAGAFGGQTDMGRVIGGLSRQIRDNLKLANENYGAALESAATPLGQRRALQFGQDLLKPSMPRDVAAAHIADMTGGELSALRDSVRAQMDEEIANVRMTISNPDVDMRQAQQAMIKISAPAVREKISMLFPDEQAAVLFQNMDDATAMLDPRRSGVSRFASARPDEEIRAVMTSPNPRAAAEQLVRQASTDQTGQALPSLKGSLIEELMGRSRTGSFDEAGEPVLSGRALKNALADRKVAPVAETVLSQEERNRLATIADELAKVEAANGRLPNIGSNLMDGEPNSVISLIARAFAARVGAHAGHGASGASLQTASMASKRMKDLLGKLTLNRAEGLIKQAVTGDRDLFEALLTPHERWTPKQENRLYNALLSTMRGAGSAAIGQMGLGSTEESEQEDPGYGDPVIDAIMSGKKPSGPSRMDLEFESYIQNMT